MDPAPTEPVSYLSGGAELEINSESGRIEAATKRRRALKLAMGCDTLNSGLKCRATARVARHLAMPLHIIHCHDWSSAPVAWLCKKYYAQSSLEVVFTIHNLEFGAHYVGKTMNYCDKSNNYL